MNGLAYIGRVVEVGEIPSSDNLVSVIVVCGAGGRWKSVVRKDEVKINDLVEVFLPDSILPQIQKFEFLRDRKFRVRQCRLRGCLSDCLIMPKDDNFTKEFSIGDDITEVYKVVRYFKPLSFSMRGDALAPFPAFIPKTDEILVQKSSEVVDALQNKPFYITLKYDGASCTCYLHDNHFGVCSRTLELKDTSVSIWWEMARKYNIEKALRESFRDDIAVQFEVIGNKIQGNPCGISGHEIRVFDLFDIKEQVYLNYSELVEFCKRHNLPMVDVLVDGNSCSSFINDFIEYANSDQLVYANGNIAEGVVVRSKEYKSVNGNRISFKVINSYYKEK